MQGKIKQRNIPWLGALIESLYSSMPMLSIINFLSIITVLYATIKDYLFVWVPWLTFGWFISIMIVLTLVMMLLVYKFLIPSLWVFRGKQLYGFESDLMTEVRAQKTEIKRLAEVIDNLGKFEGH